MKRSNLMRCLWAALIALCFVSCGDSIWGKYDNPLDPDYEGDDSGSDSDGQYWLTVIAGGGGTITNPSTSPILVSPNQSFGISALANSGYIFVDWTVVSGTGVSITDTKNANTDVRLTDGDATIQANFTVSKVVVKGLNGVCSLAFDSSGRLYVVERWAHIVSRYDTSAGTSSVYAGIRNNYGFSGDGGLAVSAQLDQPMGIAFNASGNLYIAVAENNCVRMVNTAGYISTAAGVGEVWGNTGNGAPATVAKFGNPADVAIGPDGDIYISDTANAVVRRVKASNGNIYAFAGTGTSGYSGDGGLAVSATLKLSLAAGTSCGSGIDVDNSGNVYIADTGNHVVRRVDALTGFITTIAGTGTASYGTGEGVATSVGLTDPTDVLVADDGTIYIADCYQVTTSVFDSVSKTWNNVTYNRGRVCSVSGGQLTNCMTSYDTNSVDRFSPSSLAMSPAGVLHVTDMNNGTVVRVK